MWIGVYLLWENHDEKWDMKANGRLAKAKAIPNTTHIALCLRKVVTICLLASVFLFSIHRRTHLLFGMCSYDWIHCLILLDSSNSAFIEL